MCFYTFQVTFDEVDTLFGAHSRGPIVYVADEPAGREKKHRDADLGFMDNLKDWRIFPLKPLKDVLVWLLGIRDDNTVTVKAPDPYNLYDRDPGFRNNYGWSTALDEHDYEPLKDSDIGVYIVNLTAVCFIIILFYIIKTE
jgi:hypothetical protein